MSQEITKRIEAFIKSLITSPFAILLWIAAAIIADAVLFAACLIWLLHGKV